MDEAGDGMISGGDTSGSVVLDSREWMPHRVRGKEMAGRKTQYQQIAEASALAFMFPLSIGAGFLAGYGLDHLFGSWPWLSAVGAALGVVAAFVNLFRTAARGDAENGGQGSEDGER